jgi:hypothetical protein
LAQRAYRQRKETTLDDLRKRVSDLTSTIECMNKTFEDCRDRLISTGLTESQLHDLSETTVRFAGFVKPVRRPSDSTDETAAEADAPLTPPLADETNSVSRQTEQNPLPIVKNVPSWIDQAALTHAEGSTQRSDIGMGYTMYMPNAFDNLSETYNTIPSLAQNSRIPTTLSISLSPSAELPPPKTYSFQERTLARRLHRACLEAAYHLLLDPSRRPHTFERVFKLSLLSRDRVRMAASLKTILSRGLDEPLDFWDAPILHIGGAGTHYPDRHHQRAGGFPLRDKAKFHLGVVGPQMLNLLENVVQSRPGAEVSVEIEGFEGEWFDPYDVEGYLETRGIHIDPMVSFVEAEIDSAVVHMTTGGGGVFVQQQQQQYSPNSTALTSSSRHSSSGGYNNNNNSSSTLNPASNSESSTSNTTNTTTTTTSSTHSPPFFAEDSEQWSALQLLEPDLERWREVENLPVQNVSGLGNVGFSDADTGSWMNFFDSTSSSSADQYQQNGQATTGMRNSGGGAGAFLSDLYGANNGGGQGGYGQAQANAMPSPPSGKKVVIIDVAKFVKGKLLPPLVDEHPREKAKKKNTHANFISPNSPNDHRRLSRPHARVQTTRRRSRAGRFFF